MDAQSRYPLAWPAGWRRTPAAQRRDARWSRRETPPAGQWRVTRTLTVNDALGRLQGELDRLGAREALLSTNIPTRLDGLPYSRAAEPEDPGVAVYFRLKGQARALACDRWARVADNIAALAAHIDALRRIERYGVGTMEQAFAGYAQLTAGKASWFSVLGVQPDAPVEEIERAYRRLAKQQHPDVGGSKEGMADLNRARDEGRIERSA